MNFETFNERVTTLPRQNGQLMNVCFTFRGKYYTMQLFFPTLKIPTKQEIKAAIDKIYPNARISYYAPSHLEHGKPFLRLPEQVRPNQDVEKDAKDDQETKKDLMIQRRQLIINRQKLQQQRKAIRNKKQTNMIIQPIKGT